MRELSFLVTCSCGWSAPAATHNVAAGWRRHHLESVPTKSHPLWDGKVHTVVIIRASAPKKVDP